LAIGLAIFWVYRATYQGVMYSSSFALSLVGMSLVTTLVISAVSSNLIASLGMVGALSIVRFRTVVKEPLDLVYMFWSIGAGIVVGVGLFPLALIGSVVIGLFLWIFSARKVTDVPYVIVLRALSDVALQNSLNILQSNTKKLLIKSRSISEAGVELTAEVRLVNQGTEFMQQLVRLDGVETASLVSYNGDYYM
jgi:ABC-type Fe3+ transport system permease subunit